MASISHRARLQHFDEELQAEVIDFKKLRKMCFNGIPDEQGRRAMCWKLLLNYLPAERLCWESHLKKQRQMYDHFIDEMLLLHGGGSCDPPPPSEALCEDHPLNPNPESKWQTYFRDNEVLLQIDKDVRRLCPDISFFQQATEFPCKKIVENPNVERLYKRVEYTVLKSANVTRKGMSVTKITLSKKKATEEYSPLAEGQEAHWEVVERILFIYAKLNPGQSYVQGMNEIIGPIYYTFASNPDPEWRAHAEADTFFCFTNLMSEIRDFFIKTLDDADYGITGLMNRLMAALKSHDFQLWHRLQQQELRPQFYSFRWLTLLLSQEFPLPDVIRIWDTLFADVKRFDFLLHVCCAMLVTVRDQLLENDFSANMKLLQNFPAHEVDRVLTRAAQLELTTSTAAS